MISFTSFLNLQIGRIQMQRSVTAVCTKFCCQWIEEYLAKINNSSFFKTHNLWFLFLLDNIRYKINSNYNAYKHSYIIFTFVHIRVYNNRVKYTHNIINNYYFILTLFEHKIFLSLALICMYT